MDLIFDVSNLNDSQDEFSDSKKDVLKFLKIIGVDTRFISYTPNKIYINNLRFSKFSRKREELFKKEYCNISIVRNTLFQKICSKSSKVLSAQIKPKSAILMPENNFLIDLLLEPYTRKYGVELVYEGDYDYIINPITLDSKVNEIFASIFKGEALNFNKKDTEIFPLINVSKSWIDSFYEMEGWEIIEYDNEDELAGRFMEFLDDISPQFRENVLHAVEYVETHTKS